ncbi:MAG TPA: hypothetical protein VFG33_03910 [Kribbella sp.]|uniref:alpha/beta hydrolase n=1 Tax=Kribbella sp. TaxID=1871183 RepID=UPI002D797625|nr:hypothetical protein [Kribbella sp.]HET6292487.1 hypothetical protein [Kribbella sp.]
MTSSSTPKAPPCAAGKFAEVFAAAGLAVLVFDNRGWGDSGTAPGKPRYEIDPWEQIRDYQHAITSAQNRPEVDPDRANQQPQCRSSATIPVNWSACRRRTRTSGSPRHEQSWTPIGPTK